MNITDIPFAKHIGIKEEENKLLLEQHHDIESHVQTIHAAAQFALAETQSGFYLQSLFPEYADRVLALLRGSTVKYRHPATQKVVAIAKVDEEKQQSFRAKLLGKGRATITVYVELIDHDNTVTMTGEFTWFVQRVD